MYLSVLTWNVWRPPILGRDKYQRGKKLIGAVENANPDLVLFQEVFICPDRKWLLESLGHYRKPKNAYDERSFLGVQFNATGGLATLSKYPILDSSFCMFSTRGRGIAEWFSQKGYAKTVVETPVGEVGVVNQHGCSMSWNQEIRLKQLGQLLNDPDIASDEMPVILAGDFNFDISRGDMKDLGGNVMLDGIFYKSGGGRSIGNTESRLIGEYPEVSDHFGVQSVLKIDKI